MRKFFLTSLLFLAIAGCGSARVAQPAMPMIPAPAHADVAPSDNTPAQSNKAGDSKGEKPLNVILYEFAMPFGSNSRDTQFWKLVNEDLVSVDINDGLYRNGLRVGHARFTDWPQFHDLLAAEAAVKLKQTTVVAPFSVGDALYGTKDVIHEQTVYVFNEHGLSARSYVDCQNRLSFAFSKVLRQPGAIRVTMAPVVIDWPPPDIGALPDQRHNYYDLHLTIDLPRGEFLIIGTSEATEDPNRIGSRFLTVDGPNQRFEKVLVLYAEELSTDHLKREGNPATRVSPDGFVSAH